MPPLRRSGFAIALVAGLLTVSGIAVADEHDTQPEGDTLFNFGYDAANHVFVYNTSATDSVYDCTLQNGTLTATYGEADGAVIPVDTLEGEEGTVRFHPRDADSVAEDLTPATDPVDYAGAEGACGASGAIVGGPNDQINHGQFMKLFNSLLDMRGRGCLMRWLAKSDLGKGDQQIRTSDVDGAIEPGDSGELEFTTITAACERPGKAKGEDHPGRGRGLSKHGGDRPGNSGNAPGHDE